MPEGSGTEAEACGAGPPGEEAPVCGAPQNAQKAVPSLRVAPQVEHLIIVIREQYTPHRAFAQHGDLSIATTAARPP
jgi:hypothetical protein